MGSQWRNGVLWGSTPTWADDSRNQAWLWSCWASDQGETSEEERGGDQEVTPSTRWHSPNHSLLESGWNSRVKRFARIHWFVNSSDGQLSRLHVLIRSEFCFGSDLYLLIQQNQTVSQEPIDPVRISNSGWSWHSIPVRSMFCCNFMRKT